MEVLTTLFSAGRLRAARAVDDRNSVTTAWLRELGVRRLMLAGLYMVGKLEKNGAIRVSQWLRLLLVGWIVLGAPVAVGWESLAGSS